MNNPTAAMLVIGDEILSGRTRDSNLHYLAKTLTAHGIDLCEARVVSDDHNRIVAAVNELRAGYRHVFTSGGIGPTHDDITADAVAAAFGLPIDIREDARAILAAHYERSGLEFNTARQRMARIPDTAILIENPVSFAPGFSVENVHVMAGVPKVFEAMVMSVLPHLTGGTPLLSHSVDIFRGEGEIAEPLAILAREFADISFGSYPFNRDGIHGASVVLRGSDEARLQSALTRLSTLFPDL